MKDHTKCGLHAKALALWTSGGASLSVVGALPSGVQFAMQGLFAIVYCVAKRDGNFTNVAGDGELVSLVGGSITPSYIGRCLLSLSCMRLLPRTALTRVWPSFKTNFLAWTLA